MSVRLPSLAVLSVTLLGALACSGEGDAGAVAESELLGVDTFMYLRCNSTSWNVDARSRMTDTGVPDVVELTFDVKYAWMMTTGDDCVLTETPRKDGWGNWQKYYTTATAPVVVPTSVAIGAASRGPRNFRVRFPELGRFRVTLDKRTNTLFVAKDGALQPGQVAWTAAGEIALDTHQNLYRLNPARDTLEKLDRATGSATWSYYGGGADDITFVPGCALAGTVVALQGVHVIALDVATGAKRWESSLDGALDGEFTAAYPPACREDLGKVFVSYWGGPQGVAALDLAGGQTLWNIAASGTPQIKAVTAGAVVFSDLSPSFTTTVRALAPATGVELWSYAASSAGDTPFADADDALFRLTGSQLVRIDPLAGTQIWTHSATATIPSSERGVIYVARDGVLVEKVDTASGAAAWTYPSTPGQPAPAIRLLGNTVVLSRAGNAETGFTALDATSGAELWQRIVPASYAYMTSDPLGRLFVVGAESLENVARADGSPLWVFAAPLVDGYGPSHIQSVIDGDARGVYVLFMDYGTGNAPAGLGALDPATGAARWLAFEPGSMYFVGSDATWLFMQLTGMAGPIEGRAYAK